MVLLFGRNRQFFCRHQKPAPQVGWDAFAFNFRVFNDFHQSRMQSPPASGHPPGRYHPPGPVTIKQLPPSTGWPLPTFDPHLKKGFAFTPAGYRQPVTLDLFFGKW
jgi:hypothetical protein